MTRILGPQGTIRAHGGKAVLALLVGALANGASGGNALAAPTAASAQRANIAALPLNFERNLGQAPQEVQYLAHGHAYAIELTEQGAVLAFASPTSKVAQAIHLRVQGAAHASSPAAEEPLPGIVNYFIGNDPSKWQTHVATYSKVRYSNVYPGIDLVYYGTEGKLEYDFAVSPGSDAKKIGLNFEGARRLHVDADGNLKIRTQDREIAFQTPVAYQIGDAGEHMPVSAHYRLKGTAVRFEVGTYDHSKQLIIDPVLSYFSYLGGSGYDVAGIAPPSGSVSYFSGQAAAIDSAGDLYVTGHTNSTNFPTQSAFAPAPPKANPNGGQSWAFVTKFAPDAKTLIFSTYLGGTGGNDRAASIAVDSSGNAVVVGVAESNDFPATSGAYQTVCNPQFSAPNVEVPACNTAIGQSSGAFVSKFSPSGALLHSTFLSGTGTNTSAYAVAVDATGRAYVAGQTLPGAIVPAGTAGSPQAIPFPTTAGAALVTPPYSTGAGGYQNVLSAQYDAFITVFDPTLSTLVYSSLFGEPQVSNAGAGFHGASFTFGEAVTVDALGNFYLAGTSEDGSLPTTAGAYEASASSCGTVTNNVLLNCPFVAKFSPVGSGTPSLIYGTYLGHTVISSYGDLMTGIAADAAGDAYVTGFTNQATFPTTSGAYQTNCNQYGVNGNTNAQCASAFIAKLNPSGTALLASTYFGGSFNGQNNIADSISSMGPIVLDAAGNVYIDGAASSGLPQVNSLGGSNGTGNAVSPFVAEFNSSLTTLLFSTLFSAGGQPQLVADGLALDTAGNIYVAGSVNSPPSSAATSGAFQSAYGGGSSDAFVAKIIVHTPTTTTLTAAPTSATSGTAINITATVAEVGGTSVPTGTVTFKDGTTSLGSMTLNGTGIAVYTTQSLTVGAHSITAAYGGDAANGSSTSTAASVTVTAAPAPTVTIGVAPASITLGQSATLTWSTANATACTASGAWTGSEATSGTMSVTPTAAGSLGYVLTCTGAGGSGNATASLTVAAALPTVTISVSPISITVGQNATLTWSSTHATACTASNAWTGSEAVSGTMSETPTAAGSLSYVLTCTGVGGTAHATAALTVTAPVPTVTISVAPTSITVGQSATVTWSSTNATSCTASGAWSGAEATSGTLSVTPSASGTAGYALACTGAGGTASGTASLSVAAAGGGKSGGGAMGLWELAALSLLGVAAHRRRGVART
jgi:Bacterial Ig-like domain (group 3)/Beta-propeller repeat